MISATPKVCPRLLVRPRSCEETRLKPHLLLLFYLILAAAPTTPLPGQIDAPPWAEAMRAVHERFDGPRGTLACFGDSITVTLAFWTPLLHRRKNASEEIERAFERVHAYLRPECWREWKGSAYGSEGGRTVRWAREHIDEWLGRLDPEMALILFGTNDLNSLGVEEYRATLREVVTRCLGNGTVVILSTIPPRGGFEDKAAVFSGAVRDIARELRVPLTDLHAEILKRRPDDWNGALPGFDGWKGYDVPTLIARDGVHPSHPAAFRDDYSEEALRSCGYSLRNALALLKVAEVLDTVVDVPLLRPPTRPFFPVAPPLAPPTGEILEVEDVEGLFEAARQVEPGDTILVAEGHYELPRRLGMKTSGVTLRGATGRRERVILDGGRHELGELVAITGCEDVTIADLTIQNVRWNGFKIDSQTGVQRLTIRNCIIHNVWQRGVKGVKVPPAAREHLRPTACRVEYCLFYNDHPKTYQEDPADTARNFRGNYIGGIDIMYARGWTISDNVFVGIRGRTGEARGAIFLWHEAEGCVVERNLVIDCDTGICLGNSSLPPDVPVHATACLVRNNFVVRTPETGILADYTRDCRIVHNTVHDPESRLRRLVRLVHENPGLVVANNLLSGPPPRIESASDLELRDNRVGDFTAAFVDPAAGDLHLRGDTANGLERTTRLPDVLQDIDRQARGQEPAPGADEPGARR